MQRRGPLADSYPAAGALVVCALVPFLLLTSAALPLAPLLSKSLHLSTAALDITTGLSDAGYAVGTVLAVQFAVHLPARRMPGTAAVTALPVAAGGRPQRPGPGPGSPRSARAALTAARLIPA